MSKAAFSVKAFGVYLLVLGLGLLLLPNLLLAIFGMPSTTEIWIRVVGLLVFEIGVYYWYAARSEARLFFVASAWMRFVVPLVFIAFVVLGLAKPVLILFGMADVLGGIWTLVALRKDAQAT